MSDNPTKLFAHQFQTFKERTEKATDARRSGVNLPDRLEVDGDFGSHLEWSDRHNTYLFVVAQKKTCKVVNK